MIYLVTGCLGFIGSHFVKHLNENKEYIVGIDAETYAANLNNKWAFQEAKVDGEPYTRNTSAPIRLQYIKADIATLTELPDVDVVVNFAAETHVDNSIDDSNVFTHSNVVGVQNLLNLIRKKRPENRPRFIQISTDEVYGESGKFVTTENTPLNPSNPYAASKAAADLYIQAYARTYGISYNIIRPSNCWGEGQYPEKLIPRALRCFEMGRTLPIHGDGTQTRSWLNVTDAANAIRVVIDRGKPNTIYNIGGVVLDINSVLDIVWSEFRTKFNMPDDAHWENYVSRGAVRPGMDVSYKVDDTKLRGLGWFPKYKLNSETGHRTLEQMVNFNFTHRASL